jgi:hypothetical protein
LLLEEFEDIKIVPLSAKNCKRVNDRSYSDARNGEKASHSYCIEQTGRAVGFAADAGADGEARGRFRLIHECGKERRSRRIARAWNTGEETAIQGSWSPTLFAENAKRMGHGANP